MRLPTHDVPGYETIYVECECGEDKKEELFKKLRQSTSDAIKIQFHNDPQGIIIINNKHNYTCIKYQ